MRTIVEDLGEAQVHTQTAVGGLMAFVPDRLDALEAKVNAITNERAPKYTSTERIPVVGSARIELTPVQED